MERDDDDDDEVAGIKSSGQPSMAWHGRRGIESKTRLAACLPAGLRCHASIPLLQACNKTSPCLDVGFTGGWAPLPLSGFVALLFQLVAAAFVSFRFICLDISSSMDHWSLVRACMHGELP